MTKYLGIDYGLERTGLAVTDPEGKIAFPLATLALRNFKTRSDLLDALAEMATAAGADEIVMGLPLYPDGSENMRCRQARNFAERLLRRLDLPLHFWPETYSSLEAERDLAAAGVKRKKKGEVLDQQAACRILQSFLARR